MSRHDWAVLAVIGASAFASGGLTYLASERMAEDRYDPVPDPTRVELGIEMDSEGNFFITPLPPSARRRVELGPGGELRFPPMRLKTGEGAMIHLGRRDRTPTAFRRAVPMGFNSDRESVYMWVPWSEELPMADKVRHRRPR